MLQSLKGDTIQLRALEPDDIEIIYLWENNIDSWKVSNTLVPFSKFMLKKYLENAHLDIYEVKQLRLMIETLENKPIGTIELFEFDPFHLRTGIGIIINDKKELRKGYAQEAIHVFIKYCFSVLGLHQVYCNIADDNKESLSLFQKCGFEIIAEKKDWIKDIQHGWKSEYFLQFINKDI